jgi:lipopolysaccharide export system protein LptA
MKQVVIWGVLLALIVAGVVGTQRTLERAERITREKEDQARQPSRTRRFRVHVLEGQERIAEIEAREGWEEAKKYISYFKDIRKARFYDDGKEVARVVRAKDSEGSYNRIGGLLDVKGDIAIETRGKYVLHTKRLIYNKGLRVMVCPQGLDLRDRKGARFGAQYAVFLPANESAMLIGRVRGSLTQKTTITLTGDFLRHSPGSLWTDLFGGAQAEMQMPQTAYYVAPLAADLKPVLQPGKAALSVKGYRMEGEYIQIDREVSRVSLINGGTVKVGKGNRLETSGYNPRSHAMSKLDYYWDRGYLFGTGNIIFSGENGEKGEADEVTYLAGDQVFQFAGNVKMEKPSAGWLYPVDEAGAGTLTADAVTISENLSEVNASGSVTIAEGERRLEGSLVKAWRASGRLYVEKGRLVTEDQELTAKVIEVTGQNGSAQGQVRLVRRKASLDVSGTRLRWTGKNRVELEGTVTGTRGEDRFEASQVTMTGSAVHLAGKAELRRQDQRVEADEIAVDGDTVVAEKNATVSTHKLSISAGTVRLNGKKETGSAENVREIRVTEGIGEAGGPVRIRGEKAEFSWNPISLRVPGPTVLESSSFRVEGQNFEWNGSEGSIGGFSLQRTGGLLSSGGYTMTGDRLAFKGKGYEASGGVAWKEGKLELQADQFSQDDKGNVRVSGQPTLKVPSLRETVRIQADEMRVDAERQRIDFRGGVQVSRGGLQAKADSAYVLVMDQLFVLEQNVELQRGGGDSLTAQRMLIDLSSGKITMEEITGQVHY